MEIRRTPSGLIAVWTADRDGFDVTTPLPDPERLRAGAIDLLASTGDGVDLEAAGMLGRCDLSYEVAADDEGDEADRVQVVIAAPADVEAVLTDHRHPATGALMGALLAVCPELGGDRVVRKSEDAV